MPLPAPPAATPAPAAKPATPLSEAEFAAAMTPLGGLESLALAVSGGVDSTALLLLAAHWRKARLQSGETAPRLFVLSVDHGLRPAAAAETRRVAQLAQQHGLEAQILQASQPPQSNRQAALRELRYGLLCRWCRRRDIAALLLAHQLEDQAETFLLRLGRGSGVDGLSAMARDSARQGVRLHRPLLDVPRARLQAVLESQGTGWAEDPSNRDPSHRRTRMGVLLQTLAPEGMDAHRLARTAAQMGRARAALEATASERLRRHARLAEAGYAMFDAGLLAAPDEIALRALARLVTCVGGRVYPPRLAALQRALAGLRQASAPARTLSGCKLFRQPGRGLEAGRLLAVREPAAALRATPLRLEEAAVGDLWDGRFALAFHSGACDGLEARALGADGLRQWKSTAPVPTLPWRAEICHCLPALWRGAALAGVPHLGRQANLPAGFSLVRPPGLEAGNA